MHLIVPYTHLMTNYFSSEYFKDISLPDLYTADVKYVFDENVYGEIVEELGSDYYNDKVFDTDFGQEVLANYSQLGFIAAELMPAILDELKAGMPDTKISNMVFNAIDVVPAGFVITLRNYFAV